MSINFDNVTAIALGVEEVIQIEDSLGTVLWQKAQPVTTYNVSISAGSNGTVSVNGVSGDYSQSVPAGTVLTIEGTGTTGYNFDEWSDGNTDNPRTITVNSDLTLTASFAQAVIPDYFYVEDISGQYNTLSINKSNTNAPTIEVFKSTDGTNWTSMGTTSTTAITATIPRNGKLYLKCTTDSWGHQTSIYYNNITVSGNHNVGGNIMSLLNGDNFENTTLDTTYIRQFSGLFNSNTYLVDASDLELPSNVTNYCYYSMFYGCTALTTAPALSATTLANHCYDHMFSGCTALTQAPTLPATTLADYCYTYMFYGCTSLTAAPALPATTLGTYCYQYMFSGCTSLTTAPALSATTLASYCCQYMFQNCTSLTTAPTLPATTLAAYCYRYMFQGCTSLTTAPALPATTLATYCYYYMFSGCTALTQAPTLPATTLATYCYYSMFQGCTSLTTAPTLPATTLANYCYRQMFDGCTSLTTAPALPATTLTTSCYSYMFNNCSSLTQAPTLPATTLTTSCYYSMFSGCTSLNVMYVYADNIAGGAITNWLLNVAAQGDFYALGSASWTIDSPSGVPVGWTLHTSLSEPFYIEDVSGNANTLSITKGDALAPTIDVYSSTDGTNWTSMGTTSTTPITATVPANGKLYLKATADQWANQNGINTNENNIDCSGNYNIGGNIMSLLVADNYTNATLDNNYYYQFRRLFYQSTHLIDASDLELPSNTSTGCYGLMFSGCTNLTTAPVLPATTLAIHCYTNMFSDCSSLTTAPALPATSLAQACYYFMFARCTSLTTAPALPATSLAQSCYNSMFANCSSLTTAPALPATSLAQACYEGMFWGCTSLTAAPALPATTLAMACYEDMFTQCSSLTQAPVLAATTLAVACYDKMFRQCTSLTAAPALPATTLVERCYVNMFQDCTSLTETPALPATTLADGCYAGMFQGCSSLNKVYTYADDISATNCINNWLRYVAATGDFYNLGTATYTASDPSGIPSGWTVHTTL